MQNSYILLRDNKESGALSIEELRQIGLKETDLVWIECQSWDWQRPAEIPELKNLLAAGNYNNNLNNTVQREMTGTENQAVEKTGGLRKADAGIKNFKKYSHPEQNYFEKKQEDPESTSIAAALTSTKAGQREQNAKEYAVAFINRMPGGVKKWALYACMVATGALLMLLVSNLKTKKATIVQQIPAPENSVPSIATTSSMQNTTPVTPPANVGNAALVSKNSNDSVMDVRKAKVIVPKSLPLTMASPDSQNTISNDTEKNIKAVAEIKTKPVSIEEISSKIVLTANDYKVGFMGGVRNLVITLQNNSAYVLNKATVRLDYINSAGDIVNTDQLNFQSVKPGDVKVLEVNKSKRGIKVKYYIIAIETKSAGKWQAAVPDAVSSSTN